MTWMRLDDQFYLNRKVVSAGEEAALLWLCAIAYSCSALTDGRVPRQVLPKLAYPRKALRLAERLVEVGLLEREGEDFVIHDFHEYQPTKQDVEQRRIKRAAAGRAGGKQTQSKRLSKSEADFNPTPTPTPTPDVVTSPSDLHGCGPQAVEKASQGGSLTQRLVSACSRKGPDIESEARQVVQLVKPYLDENVIDEMVGTMQNLEQPAKHPRYMLTMARTWGAQRGIEVPDLLSRLKP